MADPPPYPGTPLWVKIFGIVVGILVVLLVVVMFTGLGGPHGPGLHRQSGDTGGRNNALQQP